MATIPLISRAAVCLCFGAALAAAGCAGHQRVSSADHVSQAGCHANRLSQPAGIALEELEERIGSSARHELLSRIGREEVLVVSYPAGAAWLRLYYVFRDRRLTAIVEPPPFEYISLPYRGGATYEVRAEWDPERRVDEVLAQPALSREGIQQFLEERLPKRRSATAAPLLPLALLAAAVQLPAEAKTRMLQERLDPFKVRLGMSRHHVRDVFGAPVATCRSAEGDVVEVYGLEGERTLVEAAPIGVRVVYVDRRVAHVFSNDFFLSCGSGAAPSTADRAASTAAGRPTTDEHFSQLYDRRLPLLTHD